MILVVVYAGLFVLTMALFFFRKQVAVNYQKRLLFLHIVLLLILGVDSFLITTFNISFRTFWVDRLIAIGFLISGAALFALSSKTTQWWAKMYFGVFFFYPILTAFALLIDRIFFMIFASPLLVILASPDIYYSDKNYDIRTMSGMLAPKRVVLIEKSLLTERALGECNEESIGNGSYKNVELLQTNADSATISVDIKGKKTILTFRN